MGERVAIVVTLFCKPAFEPLLPQVALEKSMSTLAYAQLTNAREAPAAAVAAAGGGGAAGAPPVQPGIQTYMDSFAALVPAEVLTLHGLIIAATTEISSPVVNGKATETHAVIRADAMATLQWSFWGLIIASLALYIIPRVIGGTWGWRDNIRALIAPFAFLGWTMLQRTTAFDAVCPHLAQPPRTVFALFLGALLGAVTATLTTKSAPPSDQG